MIPWPDIKQEALRLGLDDLGIVPAGRARTYPIFRKWLQDGSAGAMTWLQRHADAREHPSSILPDVQTIVMALVAESTIRNATPSQMCNVVCENSDDSHAEILPYATVLDYHVYIKERLHRLALWLASRVPNLKYRAVVDSAPLLEKEWAARAGLGSVAKNSLLIHPQFGSRCFLGALLLNSAISTAPAVNDTQPHDQCRDCNRCIRACPTGAISGDRTLNAIRCLNYWTIEYRGHDFPPDIRANLGARLFGCDTCRRCCPLDDHAQLVPPVKISRKLLETMTEEEFAKLFQGTPIIRIGLKTLLRNAHNLTCQS